MSGALRRLGLFDVASGVTAVVAATWLADQLDLGVTVVRLVGVFLLVLGTGKVLLREAPMTGRATLVVESVFALAALDVAVTADPTPIGMALLVGTAVLCGAVVAWLLTLERRLSLVALRH